MTLYHYTYWATTREGQTAHGRLTRRRPIVTDTVSIQRIVNRGRLDPTARVVVWKVEPTWETIGYGAQR